MAPYSSTLAWKIPWMEEPGRLQSMGLRRVRHDWATSLSLFTFMHWRRKWQPTPVFLLENPRDGGAWWAAVYGVAQSRTRLKWLSSSSSSYIGDYLLKTYVDFPLISIWFVYYDFVWEIFLTIGYISLSVTSVFRLSISSWFNLDSLCVSRNLSISSRLFSFLLHNYL